MNIYEKLSAIQCALKAPKSQYNEFGKYKYRKCEDILEAVKPLLAEYRCIITCSDELVQIGDRYYVKATATFMDAEEEANKTAKNLIPQTVEVCAYAREEADKKGMDGSQITGASSSYARKYALGGLLCLDDNADSDTTNKGDTPAPRRNTKAAPKASPAPQQAPAPSPRKVEEKEYPGGLTERQYLSLVKLAAKNEKTKTGQDPRDAFIANCKPTPEEIDAFDDAVFDYVTSNNL